MHLVRRAPLLLLVDDFQWADTGSRELIVNLVRLAADVTIREPFRLLVVLVVRDEPGVPEIAELDLIRREDVTASLTLHGLTELDVSRLARATGARELPLGVVDELVRVTRGNPLFVLALVNQLAPSTEQAGTEELVVPRLPAEVQTLLGSRVTALSEECRAALTAAAVLGRRWDLAQLEAVTGTDLDRARRVDRRGRVRGDPQRDRRELRVRAPAVRAGGPGDAFERATPCDAPAHRRGADRSARATIRRRRSCRWPSICSPPVSRATPRSCTRSSTPPASVPTPRRRGPSRPSTPRRRCGPRTQLEESTPAARVTMSLRASRARLQCGEPQAARRNADAAIAALGANPSPESSAVAWIERLRADLFEPNPEVPIDTAPLESLAVALDPASPGIAARAYSTLAPAYWGTRRVEDARRGVLPRHRARQRLRRARCVRGSVGPARDDAVDATRARRRGHELVGGNPRSRRVGRSAEARARDDASATDARVAGPLRRRRRRVATSVADDPGGRLLVGRRAAARRRGADLRRAGHAHGRGGRRGGRDRRSVA